MGFTVLDVEQRSDEWIAARLGRLTGSLAADMVSLPAHIKRQAEKPPAEKKATTKAKAQPAKTMETAARRNLRVRLMIERLTLRSFESTYASPAMRQGVEREAAALRAYEAMTGRLVRRSGFLQHDSLMAGVSLDGHLGAFDATVEAKSPIPATHLEYLKTGKVPEDYEAQLLHGLWITGAREAHFLSYQPDFPDPLRTLLVVVKRDEKAIAAYEAKARAFLAEVDTELAAIATMLDTAAALRQSVLVA
jgi:hypothetical protein